MHCDESNSQKCQVVETLETSQSNLYTTHRTKDLMRFGIINAEEMFNKPDTPGSLEGNTEGPGSASSEPLLPS